MLAVSTSPWREADAFYVAEDCGQSCHAVAGSTAQVRSCAFLKTPKVLPVRALLCRPTVLATALAVSTRHPGKPLSVPLGLAKGGLFYIMKPKSGLTAARVPPFLTQVCMRVEPFT